jgi:hypothetical protein
MASIGKFVFGLASGEASLSLANINFDFAVVKMEPPKELLGLGNSLSKKRKFEAEEGSIHATARRLGALFAEVLPNTPNLARVYGIRASEIASNPEFNPVGKDSDGALASHIGADGTSIWAAATSSKGALQAHLLACMLARVWSRTEAISIWSELVSVRKRTLRHELQASEFNINAVTACQIEIRRDELAEWDASARSVSFSTQFTFSLRRQDQPRTSSITGLILPLLVVAYHCRQGKNTPTNPVNADNR